jgi:hypothetical protein
VISNDCPTSPMTWARGREKIERLLADGELERVTSSADVADRLMQDAEAHITLAATGTEIDPAGALQLAYDAARKASPALLAIPGRGVRRGRAATPERSPRRVLNRDATIVA